MLAITGMPGAGKSTVIKVLENRGARIISMGDVVREETKKRGYKVNEENTGRVAKELREMRGNDAVAELCVKKIKDTQKKQKVVIEGIRGLKELHKFREELNWDFDLISVHSSPSTRFKRLKERGREDDPQSVEEFRERDLRELGFGLGDVIALSDYVIVNEKGLKSFKEEIRELLKELGY